MLFGPSPAQVMSQYAGLTGLPMLPPMFSLGYHQCRWNYNDEPDVQTVSDELDKVNSCTYARTCTHVRVLARTCAQEVWSLILHTIGPGCDTR